jgi:DUF2934 family protein
MAKRNPRSEANETSPAPAPSTTGAQVRPVKGRRARSGGAAADPTQDATPAPAGVQDDETFAARGSSGDQAPTDASSSTTRSGAMSSEPSEEEIRLRAYQRYLERGAEDGMHFEDWLEAEKELKSHR